MIYKKIGDDDYYDEEDVTYHEEWGDFLTDSELEEAEICECCGCAFVPCVEGGFDICANCIKDQILSDDKIKRKYIEWCLGSYDEYSCDYDVEDVMDYVDAESFLESENG